MPNYALSRTIRIYQKQWQIYSVSCKIWKETFNYPTFKTTIMDVFLTKYVKFRRLLSYILLILCLKGNCFHLQWKPMFAHEWSFLCWGKRVWFFRHSKLEHRMGSPPNSSPKPRVQSLDPESVHTFPGNFGDLRELEVGLWGEIQVWDCVWIKSFNFFLVITLFYSSKDNLHTIAL